MKYAVDHTVECPHCRSRFSLWAGTAPTPGTLTRKQRAVLDFLRSFSDAHHYMPSFDEIAQQFGLNSLATVHEHLTSLERKGHIKRVAYESRAIILVPERVTP